MKKLHYYIGAAALALTLALPAQAQNNLPAGTLEMVVAPHNLTLGSGERTCTFEVRANVDFTLSSDAAWLVPTRGNNGRVSLHLDTNYSPEERTATVTFANAEKNISQTLVVTQTGDDSYLHIPDTPEAQAEYALIFKDEILSGLKEGVTKADLEKLTNPFAKALGMQMLEGNYRTDYRVADYECFIDPQKLSDEWNAPGKKYDQLAGVTGISIPARSKQVVMVSGIPEGMTVKLKIVAWYVGKVGSNFDGANPYVSVYTLQNGFNLIDYTYNWEGLAYICYYCQDDPANHEDLSVHFVNGVINGYLSPDKTNKEMYDLCANAPNMHMDVWGKKVHSIWTSEGLKKYCKAQDGTSLGYRQYMNVLDSLVTWEHRVLGFEKYGRVPNTRTMAYVNYTYYMFQGEFGVSFHVDQESRVLNCKTLIEKDIDAVWGLSHEWGHQHQMLPYFCWAGMGEVTNNVNSFYNIMSMGYNTDPSNVGWVGTVKSRNTFLNDLGYSTGKKASAMRHEAYIHRNEVAYSPAMLALCEEMEDSLIKPQAENPLRAVANNEVSGPETLFPFITFISYWKARGFEQLDADWFEALRQNDDPNGSQIEKQGEADKYELLASAQNYNKNGKWAVFKQRYPNSCWVTGKCISETDCNPWRNSVPFILNYVRKVSRLTGYDCTPFFEKFGFLRNVALCIGDYGTKWYVMTEDMLNEFKADMNALVESGELQPMDEEMVLSIANEPNPIKKRPTIPN